MKILGQKITVLQPIVDIAVSSIVLYIGYSVISGKVKDVDNPVNKWFDAMYMQAKRFFSPIDPGTKQDTLGEDMADGVNNFYDFFDDVLLTDAERNQPYIKDSSVNENYDIDYGGTGSWERKPGDWF